MKKKLERDFNILPSKVIFCKKCVISNQRPRIIFKDGVCSACLYSEKKKKQINFDEREKKLKKLLNDYRSKKGEWDVVVPGSGGKDSSYVAHILKHKYKMNPLCVTFAPFSYTEIGFKNFETFAKSGFNVLNFFPNGNLYRKLSRIAFEELGDNFTPFVFGQRAYCYHIARKFGINLVFFGEIAELEYGGNPAETKNDRLEENKSSKMYWKGTDINELIEFSLKNYPKLLKKNEINKSDIKFFNLPNSDELKDIRTEHASTYLNWRPQQNYYYASKFTGFRPNEERSEGTFSKYSSLDDKLDWLHFYMMYIKLGFGRATSDAAHEIREGLISRQEAVSLVKKYDGEISKKYFKQTLDYLMLDEKNFFRIVDSFRRKNIWKKIGKNFLLRHTVARDGVDD